MLESFRVDSSFGTDGFVCKCVCMLYVCTYACGSFAYRCMHMQNMYLARHTTLTYCQQAKKPARKHMDATTCHEPTNNSRNSADTALMAATRIHTT